MRHEGLSQDFAKHSMLVLVLLLMASALVALSPTAPWAGLNVDAHAAGLANPAALEPHAPIHITGDDGFNTSNGVRGGTGTAADPYLISDWLVDAALYPNSSAMIWLENTDRHVVVQNCQVIHLDTVGEQFQAFYVGKYPGENMTPIIGPPTIDLTSNVTFLDNDIESRYGYGIQIAEGSSNILAKGNHVADHPQQPGLRLATRHHGPRERAEREPGSQHDPSRTYRDHHWGVDGSMGHVWIGDQRKQYNDP